MFEMRPTELRSELRASFMHGALWQCEGKYRVLIARSQGKIVDMRSESNDYSHCHSHPVVICRHDVNGEQDVEEGRQTFDADALAP